MGFRGCGVRALGGLGDGRGRRDIQRNLLTISFTEEPAMRTQTTANPDQLDRARFARIATRQYVYPSVRPVALATAHPAAEAWPRIDSPAPGTAATRALRLDMRAGRGLRLVAGPTPAPSTPAKAEEESSARFAALQSRMATVEQVARAGGERSIVVVPSRTIDKWHEPPAETQAYEERLLCSLLELRDPSVRMTYVTSSPIAPSIIDYYLALLPPRIRRNARSRLTLVALGERTARPLSAKLLERSQVLERIRRTIVDPAACHLAPYNTTSLERDVALQLGIPMYGADPRLGYLGTKSGCRELFAQAGVLHPLGVEKITTVLSAVAAIVKIRTINPATTRVVIKLNEGVSGEGNALVDLAGLPEPGAADESGRIARRVATLAPEAAGVTAAEFLAKLAVLGGVVEQWISGQELRSPSVQLRITPFGEVQVLSTHDQILGGPGGQSYLGCRFPATPSYAPAISKQARRIGELLAARGVIGRFAIDFVVTRNDNQGWQPFAIELNLRKGGTTHPFETLTHLTGGSYEPDTATFRTATGHEKHYVATDHLEAPALRSLGRDGVLGLARTNLRFDALRRQGVVFHMLSSLDELGRAGFTAIADSADEADAISHQVTETLLLQAVPARSARRHDQHAAAGVV